MSMTDWARREVEIACKKENPNWDGKSFDYGCACYQSALKAYESLCGDGHSGFSFSMTRSILERLMNGLPLTPITEEDFNNVPKENNLPNKNGSVDIQCPRMYSLFKSIDKDGNVTYRDIDRVVCVNAEYEDDTFSSARDKIVDEMFPIQLPYCPPKGNFKLYLINFATDNCKGDYDTTAILYLITPDGERVDINKYYAEDLKSGKMVEISEYMYKERLARRRDTIDKIFASRLLNHILYLHESDDNDAKCSNRVDFYNRLPKEARDEILYNLTKLSAPVLINLSFSNYETISALAKGTCEIPELQRLQDYINGSLHWCSNK